MPSGGTRTNHHPGETSYTMCTISASRISKVCTTHRRCDTSSIHAEDANDCSLSIFSCVLAKDLEQHIWIRPYPCWQDHQVSAGSADDTGHLTLASLETMRTTLAFMSDMSDKLVANQRTFPEGLGKLRIKGQVT